MKEAYAVLEIADGSSLDEAKTAYRRLCIVWHPDRFQNAELKAHAEEKLKRINEAFATIETNGGTSGSSAAGESGIGYQDLHCRYQGGDPRLWPVSPLEFKGRACAVHVTVEGLLLVTFRDGKVDQSCIYPPDAFVRLFIASKEWIRSVDRSRYFASYPRFLSPGELHLNVIDPEGLLSRPILVKLKFRSSYYAQLFVKRIGEAWGLIHPERKPVPKPPPKPQPAPKPKPAAKPESKPQPNPVQPVGSLTVLGWSVAFAGIFTIIASVAWILTTPQKPNVARTRPNHDPQSDSPNDNPVTTNPRQDVVKATNPTDDQAEDQKTAETTAAIDSAPPQDHEARFPPPVREVDDDTSPEPSELPPAARNLPAPDRSANGRSAHDFATLAAAAYKRGDYEATALNYRRAIETDPDHCYSLNGLAWILATCPEDKFRDGPEALGMAWKVIRLKNRPEGLKWLHFGTLAAAYAEAGYFDAAAEVQEVSLKITPPEQLDAARRRLELYRSRQRYRTEAIPNVDIIRAE